MNEDQGMWVGRRRLYRRTSRKPWIYCTRQGPADRRHNKSSFKIKCRGSPRAPTPSVLGLPTYSVAPTARAGPPQRTGGKDKFAERLESARHAAHTAWDTLTSSTPSPPFQDSVRLFRRWTTLSSQAKRHRKWAEAISRGWGGKRARVSRKESHSTLEIVVFPLHRSTRSGRDTGLLDYNSQNSQRTALKSFTFSATFRGYPAGYLTRLQFP